MRGTYKKGTEMEFKSKRNTALGGKTVNMAEKDTKNLDRTNGLESEGGRRLISRLAPTKGHEITKTITINAMHRSFLEKRTVALLTKEVHDLYEGPLSFSQDSSTVHQIQSTEYSPRPHNLLHYDRFQYLTQILKEYGTKN